MLQFIILINFTINNCRFIQKVMDSGKYRIYAQKVVYWENQNNQHY